MLNEQETVEIHWADEFDEEKRAELRGLMMAFNGALTELETDATAVFSSDGERNGMFHGFLKRWDKAWSTPGPCMHDGCPNTSISRSHTISLGTSIRLVAEKGHVLTPRMARTGSIWSRLVSGMPRPFPDFAKRMSNCSPASKVRNR